MNRVILHGFLSCLFLCLVACQTGKNNNAKEAKIVDAAKINSELGIVYLEQHDVQRAKQKLLLALDEAPQIPEPWYAMAYYLEVTGDMEGAKKDYEKAISIDPVRGDAHNNYGTFLCRRGAYNQAILQFLQSMKDPNYLDTASAYENAGLCASKIPDTKLAMQYFDYAILQDPNRPVALYESAKLNYEIEDFALAKKRIDQYITIEPANPAALKLRAEINKKVKFSDNELSDAFESLPTNEHPDHS